MGLNFQYYDGLQSKIRAGIINEHECTYLFQIPGADTAAIAAISAAALTNGGRLCGRALSSAGNSLTNAASIVTGTVCGKSPMYGISNPLS